MQRPLTCFKAYDVRGQIGTNLDTDIVRRIGRAFVSVTGASRIVVGHDCRQTSLSFKDALADGLASEGADVVDLGQCGTEEVYFATTHLEASGGIIVTASHNPIGDNGLKFVGPQSAPLPQATFEAIASVASNLPEARTALRGKITRRDTRTAYAAHLCGLIDPKRLPHCRIVVNAGNGVAGAAFDAIADRLAALGAPLDPVRVQFDPDGRFPKGIPNPLLPENRAATTNTVIEQKADLGIAWDADFDRCFFFDHSGAFVPGEYVVALLATACLHDETAATIVHDPRVFWCTQSQVHAHGGRAHVAKTGHANIKRAMRATGAAYGGEMSAHHYFRDFMCCDSGMLPWLKVLELMGRSGQSLAGLVAGMRQAHPSSGELNFRLHDPLASQQRVFDAYRDAAKSYDHFDGLSMEFENWRFNLRASSTEPVLRLNVETRGDHKLLAQQTATLVALIER